MTYFVDPKTYYAFKDRVLELSQSIQINYPEHLPPSKRRPGLSDEQIAERLGFDVFTAREIRCVAEREYYGLDEWQKALAFKERACRGYAKTGLSSATKKYLPKRKRS